MTPTLTVEQRLMRLERGFAELGRRHLALEAKYLELVKLLFEEQPPVLVTHNRQILARQLAVQEKP